MSRHDRKKDSAEKTKNSAADSTQDKSVQNDSVQKEIFYASKEKLLTAIRDYIAEFLEDYGESDEYKEYEDYYENEDYRDYEDAERELTTPTAPRFRSKAPASRAGFEVASIPDGESYLARPEASALSAELEKLVATLDESFFEMLTRKIICPAFEMSRRRDGAAARSACRCMVLRPSREYFISAHISPNCKPSKYRRCKRYFASSTYRRRRALQMA